MLEIIQAMKSYCVYIWEFFSYPIKIDYVLLLIDECDTLKFFEINEDVFCVLLLPFCWLCCIGNTDTWKEKNKKINNNIKFFKWVTK